MATFGLTLLANGLLAPSLTRDDRRIRLKFPQGGDQGRLIRWTSLTTTLRLMTGPRLWRHCDKLQLPGGALKCRIFRYLLQGVYLLSFPKTDSCLHVVDGLTFS